MTELNIDTVRSQIPSAKRILAKATVLTTASAESEIFAVVKDDGSKVIIGTNNGDFYEVDADLIRQDIELYERAAQQSRELLSIVTALPTEPSDTMAMQN